MLMLEHKFPTESHARHAAMLIAKAVHEINSTIVIRDDHRAERVVIGTAGYGDHGTETVRE